MNRIAIARELISIARELRAIEFPTQDAMDKYLKEHPDADRSKHKVVETKKEAPAKKEEPEKKESKPLSWKKNDVEDLGGGSKRYEYVSGDYTIDVAIAPDKDQGYPGSNMVTVLTPKGFLHGGSKMFKSVKEAEAHVEKMKKKLEEGDEGKKIHYTS